MISKKFKIFTPSVASSVWVLLKNIFTDPELRKKISESSSTGLSSIIIISSGTKIYSFIIKGISYKTFLEKLSTANLVFRRTFRFILTITSSFRSFDRRSIKDFWLKVEWMSFSKIYSRCLRILAWSSFGISLFFM